MAYRPLVVGDKVKVMEKGHPWFNQFSEVLDVTSVGAEVRIDDNWRWFKQSDLMVASDDLSGSIYRFRYAEQNTVDDEDECEYANYTHEDLVELIGFLKSELAKLEN